MSSGKIKVGILQHACDLDKAPNLERVERLARDAAGQGAQLIVTQELFASQYFPQTEDPANFDLAEPIPGPTTDRLSKLAKELGVVISASLFEKRAAGLYHNTSVMIEKDGSISDRYRKMHIPDDPGFYEKYYFTPGDLGFRAQRLDGCTAGMLVCWDQWFPEAARLTALRGAQVLLYPTAIGWARHPDGSWMEDDEERAQQRTAWRTVQVAHAITNGVYVIAANRIGLEGGITFWGGSFVADPTGRIIAEASADEEAVLVVDLDMARIDAWRKSWPFLRDRRIDAYEPLTRRLID